MKCSIVIPNLNSNVINKTLDSINTQAYDKNEYEVIVVGLDEPGLVKPFQSVIFDKTERPYLPSEARNRGARHASGELLVFIDLDCIPPPHWLHQIISHFDDPQVAGVGGGVRFQTHNYWNIADNFSWFHEFLDTHPTGIRQLLPSLNITIRKELFFSLEGFSETLPTGEDFDFTSRITNAGYRLLFDPLAWIMHAPERNSLKILWKHAYNIGLYSTKIGSNNKLIPGLPDQLRNRRILYLFSPLLAFGATFRAFVCTPNSLHYLYTWPAVFLSKIAWCFGAANSPRLSNRF